MDAEAGTTRSVPDGGELGALIRGFDWSRTSIGPLARWPQSLLTTVQLLLHAPLPMVLLWGADGVMIYNDPYAGFAGRRHPRLLGCKVLEGWPEVAAFNSNVLQVGLAGGTLSYRDQHLVLSRNDVPEDVWLDLNYGPVHDESGRPAGVLAVVVETTERILAERRQRHTEEALREREAELARVQRIGRIGGMEVDLRDGFRNRRSPEYLRLHGLSPDDAHEPHGAWVQRLHPEERARVERDFRNAVAGTAREYRAEYRIIRPSDGEVRWIAARAEIERDPVGRPLRLVGAHIDITDRKRAEEHRELLIHELNHRVKNTLATVQSIAAQTLRNASDLEEARQAFESRLMALSRAHDVLTRESWEGASLGEIVAQAVEPYRNLGEERLRLNGPELRVPPRMALALAMALQELATNAVKYGALSNEAGRVSIAWRVGGGDPAVLQLRWEERGGPPVAPPTRRGFGTRLIERSLAQDLDGEVRIDFAPTGVVCTVEAPL